MKFSDLLTSEKPVLIDFYADWCAPCRMVAPILEDAKRQFGERVSVFKLDVDRNPMVAQTYNVMSIPTLILFKNGSPVWRHTGVVSATELKKVLESHAPKEDVHS